MQHFELVTTVPSLSKVVQAVMGLSTETLCLDLEIIGDTLYLAPKEIEPVVGRYYERAARVIIGGVDALLQYRVNAADGIPVLAEDMEETLKARGEKWEQEPKLKRLFTLPNKTSTHLPYLKDEKRSEDDTPANWQELYEAEYMIPLLLIGKDHVAYVPLQPESWKGAFQRI